VQKVDRISPSLDLIPSPVLLARNCVTQRLALRDMGVKRHDMREMPSVTRDRAFGDVFCAFHVQRDDSVIEDLEPIAIST
jgi:hypothetical protein